MAAILSGLIAFATGGIARWLALAAVLAAAGGGFYIRELRQDVALLTAQKVAAEKDVQTAVDTAKRTELTLSIEREEAFLRELALERERDAFAVRAGHLQSMIGEIKHAPKSADGPVAPVLRDTLGRLRGIGTRATGADAGGIRANEGPGRPADMRGVADPAGS